MKCIKYTSMDMTQYYTKYALEHIIQTLSHSGENIIQFTHKLFCYVQVHDGGFKL